jgi:predicted RNA binding protein YcfA (HicA-like mRNA interferase family)
MSDKNLDELLSGLKKEYERMPEQVDKRTIMQRIFRKEKKPRFGKVIPLFAVIAGLILFMLVALPYVGDYDQAENNPNYLEMYYLNALEDYKESLGMEDIEEFNEVTHAESVVESYRSSPGSEDYEAAKEEIDYLLITPKEIVEEAKSEGEFFADDEQFNSIMSYLASSFQEYFSDLLVEYSIQRKDQDAILIAQDNPENYKGPSEIKDFLIVLEEQGFRVSRQEGVNQLRIGRDFSWQLEQSEGLSGNEGYMQYLELMSDITEEEIPWNEMDSILLKVEYLYDAYPDERETIFENTSLLLGEAAFYLREYLALSLFNDEIEPEVLLQEYNSFLEAHEDSRFWEIVKARVDAIEMASTDYLNLNVGGVEVYLLFNEQFEGITFNDIINLNYDDRYRAQDIQDNYVEYSETRNEKLLEDLEGAEMALLYKYAFERRNAALYSTFYAEDSKWSGYDEEELHEALMDEGWMNVFDQSSHAVIQSESNRLTVTFIYHTEASAQMEWVKKDGVWKLMDKRVEEIPQSETGF